MNSNAPLDRIHSHYWDRIIKWNLKFNTNNYIKLHQISCTEMNFLSKGLILIWFFLLCHICVWLRQLRMLWIKITKIILKIESTNWAINRTFQPRLCTISMKYMLARQFFNNFTYISPTNTLHKTLKADSASLLRFLHLHI